MRFRESDREPGDAERHFVSTRGLWHVRAPAAEGRGAGGDKAKHIEVCWQLWPYEPVARIRVAGADRTDRVLGALFASLAHLDEGVFGWEVTEHLTWRGADTADSALETDETRGVGRDLAEVHAASRDRNRSVRPYVGRTRRDAA